MFGREYEYNPSSEEIKKSLRYDYSLANGKIIEEHKGRFVRVNDYPYSNVLEHYLLVPKLCHGKGVFAEDRISMFYLEEKRANKGYMIVRNPTQRQSIKIHYHKHLIKL